MCDLLQLAQATTGRTTSSPEGDEGGVASDDTGEDEYDGEGDVAMAVDAVMKSASPSKLVLNVRGCETLSETKLPV